MSKARASYDLQRIQALVRGGRYVITGSAQRGASALDIGPAGLLDVVLRLTRWDFYKTMPAQKVEALWQDVYRPRVLGTRMYVKLQINFTGDAVVISFKEL